MKNAVVLKGDKGGIHIIIQPNASLEAVLEELEHKLKGTKGCYMNSSPINVSFEGKELTDDEKEKILYAFIASGLNVCINIKNTTEKTNNSINEETSDKDGLFYIGNLKNGQSINALCSVIIIGNVEKGASVYSNGNIVITGELKGFAKAGCDGREDAFVYSMISGRNY